jgi:2'-5' RNA ligase
VVAWADDGLVGARILHEHIHQALAGAGLLPAAEPNIEPHLTLLRTRAETPLKFIDPMKWTVREFLLLDSVQGTGRQVVLARWPLTG